MLCRNIQYNTEKVLIISTLTFLVFAGGRRQSWDVPVVVTDLCHCIQDEKVTGRKADVILAAHHAAEAALRLVKPGNEVCWFDYENIHIQANSYNIQW